MILYRGDPHGRFNHIRRAAESLRPMAIVLLGDMELANPLADELGDVLSKTWFIHGNHDTDTLDNWRHVWRGPAASRNLDVRVHNMSNGTRVAGLGGIFREGVWHPGLPDGVKYRNRSTLARRTPRQDRLEGGPTRLHWSSIFPDEFDQLAHLRTDVLVIHEAPSYHPHGFAVLDKLALSMGAKLVIHGHHHDRLDSSERWEAQGFKTIGVGLRGITAVTSDGRIEVVQSGEMDDARAARRQVQTK